MNNSVSDSKASFYTSSLVIILGSCISCALWGSAAPCIKIGYRLFDVDTAQLSPILLFAGIRFTLAGLLVAAAISIRDRRPVLPSVSDLPQILLLGLSQTAIQYSCFYTGVAHTSSLKASLYNGAGPFLNVLVSCLIFHLENFSLRKFAGCFIGFAGLVLIVLDGSDSNIGGFALTGEGLVVAAGLSSAVASCFARHFTKKQDPLMLCAYQFITGGLIMVLTGLFGGGNISYGGLSGSLLMLYMGMISSVAFGIRMVLLKYNNVSRIAVYNFLTPVFGVIFSALILGENAFSLRLLISLLLVILGIYTVNHQPRPLSGHKS